MNLQKLMGGFPARFYFISLSGLLYQIGFTMVNPIFTLHLQNVGATVFQIGTILSIQALLLLLLRVPLTLVARRIGERRMLMAAFVFHAGTRFLWGIAPNPSWFYLIPVVQIVSSGVFFQLITAMNSNRAPSERQGEAMGRHLTILSLAMFIGPAITGLLVNHVSYKTIFLLAGVLPLFGLLLFWNFSRGADLEDAAISTHETPSFKALRSIAGRRNVIILAFIRTLYSSSNSTFMTLFSLYAVNTLGFTAAAVSGIFSLLGIANTLVKVPMGTLSDRYGRRRLLLVVFTAIILIYLGLSISNTYLPIAIGVALFGATWGARATVEWGFLTSLVEPDVKNLAVSYLENFWDLGATTGSFLAGVLSGFLPVPTILLILAAMNAPALPAIYFIQENKDRDQ